jgi:hypothetical protein
VFWCLYHPLPYNFLNEKRWDEFEEQIATEGGTATGDPSQAQLWYFVGSFER